MTNTPPALTTDVISGAQGSFTVTTSLQWPYDTTAASVTPIPGFVFTVQPVDNSACINDGTVRQVLIA